MVEHHRDHGRVAVAEHAPAHPNESLAELVRVAHELRHPFRAAVARGRILPHDHLERGEYLLSGGRRHGRRVQRRGRVAAQRRDHVRVGCEVAANRAKRLGKRAHHDVHIRRRYAEEVSDSTSTRPNGPDRVRLVEVQVRAVLFLERHNLAQPRELALH